MATDTMTCPVCNGDGHVRIIDSTTPRGPNAAPPAGDPSTAPARVTPLGRLGSAALLPAAPAAQGGSAPLAPSTTGAGSGAEVAEGVDGGLIAILTGLVLGATLGAIAATAAAPYVYGWLA